MRHKISSLIFVLFFSSCSTSAIMIMKDGSYENGEITDSTLSTITIRESDGSEKTIQTIDVRDIDHPGNGHLVIGGVFSSVGLMNGLFGSAILLDLDPESDFSGPARTFGQLLVGTSIVAFAAGIPMMIWGGKTWNTSKENLVIESIKISVGNGVGLEMTF